MGPLPAGTRVGGEERRGEERIGEESRGEEYGERKEEERKEKCRSLCAKEKPCKVITRKRKPPLTVKYFN